MVFERDNCRIVRWKMMGHIQVLFHLAIACFLFRVSCSWQCMPARSVMAMRFMNGLTGIINALSTPSGLKVMVETLGFQHLDLDPWRARVKWKHIGWEIEVSQLPFVRQTFLRCCFWIWIEMQKVQSHCSLLEKPSQDMTHPLSSINLHASSLFRNDLQNSSHSLVLPKIHGMLKIVEIILKLCIY